MRAEHRRHTGAFARSIRRIGAGWVHTYAESELLDVFKYGGFEKPHFPGHPQGEGTDLRFQIADGAILPLNSQSLQSKSSLVSDAKFSRMG
jgi:hypothetical protein